MADMGLVVVGAAGRMGRMLVRMIHQTPGARLMGAVEAPGSSVLGQDAGTLAGIGPLGVEITDDALDLFSKADGVIDFTTPVATRAYAAMAAQSGIVHIVGTTGLLADDIGALKQAAQKTVIVQEGNMSLGVNLLSALVRKAASILGPEFDIEIVEMHHRMKVDAPSGTALMLGEAAAEGRAVSLDTHAIEHRHGMTGVRPEGHIGFASLRGGTVIGEHSAIFAGAGERLVLSHIAEDRALFASGAVRAALWAKGKAAGFYGMDDGLDLKNF
jgi:4-hydroxy-tetrahydrodipicolinate reductase